MLAGVLTNAREEDVLWSESYIAGIVRQGARKFKKIDRSYKF